MGDSKGAEYIAALGGAKGIMLILTTISSLSFGGFKWDRAVQAETQRDNVIEGQRILVEQQAPAIKTEPSKPQIIQKCPDCRTQMKAHIKEFH